MSDANGRQVGGDHYRVLAGDGEQHWDRMWRLWGPGYFIGCITKYVERYPLKGGLQDLEKARHYLEKLIELVEAGAPGGTATSKEKIDGTSVPGDSATAGGGGGSSQRVRPLLD